MPNQYKNWLDAPASAYPTVPVQATQEGVVPLATVDQSNFFGVTPGGVGMASFNYAALTGKWGSSDRTPYTAIIRVSDEAQGWDPNDPALWPSYDTGPPNRGFVGFPGFTHAFPVHAWPRIQTEDGSFRIGAQRTFNAIVSRYNYTRPGTYRVYEYRGTGLARGIRNSLTQYSYPLSVLPEPYTFNAPYYEKESPGYWRRTDDFEVVGVNFGIAILAPLEAQAGSTFNVNIQVSPAGLFDQPVEVSLVIARTETAPAYLGSQSPGVNQLVTPGNNASFFITLPDAQKTGDYRISVIAHAHYVTRRVSANIRLVGKGAPPPPPPPEPDDPPGTGDAGAPEPLAVDSVRQWIHDGVGKTVRTRHEHDFATLFTSGAYPVDFLTCMAVDERKGTLYVLGKSGGQFKLFASTDGGKSRGDAILSTPGDASAMEVDSERGLLMDLYSSGGGQVYQRVSTDGGSVWTTPEGCTYRETADGADKALTGKPRALRVDERRGAVFLRCLIGNTLKTLESTDSGQSYILRD